MCDHGRPRVFWNTQSKCEKQTQSMLFCETEFLNISYRLIQLPGLVEVIRRDGVNAEIFLWLMEVVTCSEATDILTSRRIFYNGPLPPSPPSQWRKPFPGSPCFHSRRGISSLLERVRKEQLCKSQPTSPRSAIRYSPSFSQTCHPNQILAREDWAVYLSSDDSRSRNDIDPHRPAVTRTARTNHFKSR